MKNKELILRRIQSLNGKLKSLRSNVNFHNTQQSISLLNEIDALMEDLQSIIEREQ